jgi:hypothetical protein
MDNADIDIYQCQHCLLQEKENKDQFNMKLFA